jgi:hypothetical protein
MMQTRRNSPRKFESKRRPRAVNRGRAPLNALASAPMITASDNEIKVIDARP